MKTVQNPLENVMFWGIFVNFISEKIYETCFKINKTYYSHKSPSSPSLTYFHVQLVPVPYYERMIICCLGKKCFEIFYYLESFNNGIIDILYGKGVKISAFQQVTFLKWFSKKLFTGKTVKISFIIHVYAQWNVMKKI